MAADLPKHPVFTRVYQRSFDAYCQWPLTNLESLMAAFVVDPHEAEDAFESFGVEGTPHSLEFIADRNKGLFGAALETISQWARSQEDARDIIAQITKYNTRLGVWCATRVVRQLRAYPQEPVAIAEAFVMSGERTNDGRQSYDRSKEMIKRNARAKAAWNSAVLSASYAALASSLSESTVFTASAITPKVVGTAADSLLREKFDYAEDVTAQEQLRQLLVLRDVIAQGCLSFPVIP